ncbi:transmembrane protein 177-like [Planococcus citri]|uniref:transmembrane protein 177-like n=1 Tax=Planococcus citri TaxID=170843 RepID=UPI0031F72BE2
MFRRLLREEFIIHSLLGTGAVGFVAIYSAQALVSDRIANTYKLKKTDGEPVPLRAHIKIRFDEVLSDFSLTDWQKKFYNVFVCEGLEPFHLGSTQVSRGVYIGIPQFIQAADEEEIKKCKILINDKPVDWDSPDGERLLESLVLSEKAQKFVLAKLILQGDTYRFLFESFLPSLLLSTYYVVGFFAHKFLNLLHKPFGLSIVVHSAIGGFIVLIYLFLRDGMTISYDKSFEEKIYSKGEAYIMGGIEFYEKRIQRNKALRNLVKNGERRYSVLGNEMSFFRSKGLPETFKLKVAVEALEKNYQKQYATQIPTPRKPQPIM